MSSVASTLVKNIMHITEKKNFSMTLLTIFSPVSRTADQFINLSPVSMTPLTNLSLVSKTQITNLSPLSIKPETNLLPVSAKLLTQRISEKQIISVTSWIKTI
jgi:hypothetical protein